MDHCKHFFRSVKARVKAIINKKGGYREKQAISGNFIIDLIQWDNNYHVVKVYNRENNFSCELELISGRITG